MEGEGQAESVGPLGCTRPPKLAIKGKKRAGNLVLNCGNKQSGKNGVVDNPPYESQLIIQNRSFRKLAPHPSLVRSHGSGQDRGGVSPRRCGHSPKKAIQIDETRTKS